MERNRRLRPGFATLGSGGRIGAGALASARVWVRQLGVLRIPEGRPCIRTGVGCVWQARPLRTTTERRPCSPPVHRGSADRTGGDARQRAGRLRQGPEPAGEMRGRSGHKPPRGTPGCWHPRLTDELATWRPAPPLFEPHQTTPTSPQSDARRSGAPILPGRSAKRGGEGDPAPAMPSRSDALW